MPRPMPPAWEASFLSYEVAEKAAGHSERSIANRRSSVSALAIWLVASENVQSPADITPQMMQRYFIHAYKVRERSGVRTHYNDLRAFFKNETAESGMPSPMAKIRRPQDVVTPATILDGRQFAALLAACAPRRPAEGETVRGLAGINARATRDRAMILLLAESGMRRMELRGLDISDVDIKNRQAVIRRGKGSKPRIVAFGTQAAQALLRWERVHPLIRHGLDDGPLFCVASSGKRLELYSIGCILRRRGEAAGIPGLHPHMLRHLWAHHCMAAGMQETQIQKLAGWSSGQQLLRYGAALAEQRALEAARSIDITAAVLAS